MSVAASDVGTTGTVGLARTELLGERVSPDQGEKHVHVRPCGSDKYEKRTGSSAM